MSKPQLALYRYEGCPFCYRVERTLSDLGLDAEIRDIYEDRKWLSDLMQHRNGRRTVPVLRIQDGDDVTYLPESRDIILWLRAHHAA